MSKHLCESCKISVNSDQPKCVCGDIEWNDEPINEEGQKWYNAGIIRCAEYDPVQPR